MTYKQRIKEYGYEAIERVDFNDKFRSYRIFIMLPDSDNKLVFDNWQKAWDYCLCYLQKQITFEPFLAVTQDGYVVKITKQRIEPKTGLHYIKIPATAGDIRSDKWWHIDNVVRIKNSEDIMLKKMKKE